ncbi:MAG: UDP-2,3-diacylglucosamine diphosphatase [Bacteroidia bacterium]|nr:MAG: UDP-2,3-diacylglucosamine diphosphatase [Bacteroidia bacterium]
MHNRDKIYFISDSHLGIPGDASGQERERMMVRWFDTIRHDAREVYLLGDIFDFWFEYRTVVPKGFVRLLGKIAELTDQGIHVHFFTGNHDLWVYSYFEEELGVTVHHKPIFVRLFDHSFHIGHGDGLGPGDSGYKIMKKVFSSRICQRMFAALHPGLGIKLAWFMSGRSRSTNHKKDKSYLGQENEWLIQYCREVLHEKQVDYFVFGHRHIPMKLEIAPGAFYVNTGDWVKHFSYVVFDGKSLQLEFFK